MSTTTAEQKTQPIVFISHGSPALFDNPGDSAYKYLEKLPSLLPQEPKALVVISAHWEASQVTVTSSTKLIYDFYGFPSHMYKATWPAPEDSDLAQKVLGLIQKFAPDAEYDAKRGIDHGVWSPLKISYPNAHIPVVQVSLKKGLDLDFHVKLGAALRPLADENILIIGSGGSTHNLGGIGGTQQAWATDFEKFVAEAATLPTAEERNAALTKASSRADWRKAHPREEHYVPLLVASGAAAGKGKVAHFTWAAPNFGMTQVIFDAHDTTL